MASTFTVIHMNEDGAVTAEMMGEKTLLHRLNHGYYGEDVKFMTPLDVEEEKDLQEDRPPNCLLAFLGPPVFPEPVEKVLKWEFVK